MLKTNIATFFSLFRKKEEHQLQKDIKKISGFTPKNIQLYKQALLHRSVSVISKTGNIVNNERLEFLGDAVLGMCIAEYLYQKYPNVNEGELTKTRSRLVNGQNLEKLSKQLGIYSLIVSRANLRKSVHISGDAMEAFIGALYLDLGLKKAKHFISTRFLKICEEIEANAESCYNYKSTVIEWCQQKKIGYQFNTIAHKYSNNYRPLFICNLIIGCEISGVGFGHSKKDAEQNAARETLYSI